MDPLELMQMILGHPEADLRVNLGEFHVDVQDVRYFPDQQAVVLLLHPDELRALLQRHGR